MQHSILMLDAWRRFKLYTPIVHRDSQLSCSRLDESGVTTKTKARTAKQIICVATFTPLVFVRQ